MKVTYRLLAKLKSYFFEVPLMIGLSRLRRVSVSYQPDSYALFQSHAEFDQLYLRFRKKNRLNNSGDTARLWSLILNIKQVVGDGIQGDFAELGVWRGNTAAVLAHFAASNNRQVFLFDTFEGFDAADIRGVDKNVKLEFSDTSVDVVKDVIGEDSRVCRFIKGHFPNSLAHCLGSSRFSVVSLDCDLYEPMKSGLAYFYPRLEKGGIIFMHDYSSGH